MINHNMKIGQKVMFHNSVVKRCGHDKIVADMRGIIISAPMCDGKVIKVDTQGTYPNEEGDSIRCIPIKNLVVFDK